MLSTTDVREELQAAFPHAALHPMDCDCGHCRFGSDPIALRHERVVRWQAFVLGAALIGLYGMALLFAPHIIASFSVKR